MKKTLLLFFLMSCVFYAQKQDSVRNYKLNEITVKGGLVLDAQSVSVIGLEKIKKTDANSLYELSKNIPATKYQTNSRGESLIYLRGLGKRQLTLFWDGVPMNIPWDNTIDLDFVPLDAVGEISVTKGIPSIVYGPNTLAGVINVNSLEYSEGMKRGKLSLQGGENEFQKYSASWIDKAGKFTYFGAVNYNKTNGFTLPSDFENDENSGRVRKNSSGEKLGVFAKLKYDYEDFSNIGFSVSYLDANKKSPTELNSKKPRYWEYPDWKKLTAGVNGVHSFVEDNSLFMTYSISLTKFDMQINQYKDINFTGIDDIEKDDDLTYNGRVIFTKIFSKRSLLNLSFNGITTTHKEKFLEDNYATELEYSQNILSAGAEYEFFGDRFTFALGSGVDRMDNPKTGDKPSSEEITAINYNANFTYDISKELMGSISYGRRTRFPTLRETFSGALGKFEPNPDLEEETANTFEIGTKYSKKNIVANIAGFYTLLDDGVVKTKVVVDGEKKEKRINKDAIRMIGVETYCDIDLSANFNLSFNATYMKSDGKNSEGEFKDTVEYKPEWIVGVCAEYKATKELSMMLEANYLSESFGLPSKFDNYQRVADYLLVNARLAYDIEIHNVGGCEIFVRLNNALDKINYPQWGLPGPGREIRMGTTLNF